MLEIRAERKPVRPLDTVSVHGAEDGFVVVRDGLGRQYVRMPAAEGVSFRVSGALGHHLVCHEDDEGRVLEAAGFPVDCKTGIDDGGAGYARLLDMLYWTMVARWGSGGRFRHDGKVYRYFVGWLRDHVHTLKGMKYYDGDLKTAIELYADTQREDGMIWDKTDRNCGPRPGWRDFEFGRTGFIRPADGGLSRMERIPVENDVEYLFVEGLYYTWKATGDDAWMAGLLDNAMRAYAYSTTDPYRWSEAYGLLKRGFTIDTWDFQSAEDTAISGTGMTVDKDRTRFGVMHGDNTGFIAGCRYLAEMLDVAGRAEEAEKYRRLRAEMKERLDGVSWNGEFYTHHVPEDPDLVRDLGVDQSRQVSLSNAYALNRGLTHEQCVAIIRTYQRIREEMPDSSPGEFYQIYPPFERGFGGHNARWEYMNGGVTTIVAGELAHGAFEHGFEQYGADILNRVRGWGEKHDGYLDCTYRGAMPDPPERSFTVLDLQEAANVDFGGESAEGVPGWCQDPIPGNDMAGIPTGRQVWQDIPFDVIDPAGNGRRACIGLSAREDYLDECSVPVGGKAASIYFLHTLSGGGLAGWITLRYEGGEHHTQYVTSGREIGPWYMPRDPRGGRRDKPGCKVAWWGPNGYFPNVGVFAYGLDNPHPDRAIERIEFHAAESRSIWFLLGVTLCDAPVFFMPGDVSFGIPDNWGAAAVVYALIEGLAGMVDTGRAYDRALLAPRWVAAGVREVAATARYEASGGYLRYTYSLDEPGNSLSLRVAGNADATRLELLLPVGKEPATVALDGEEVQFELKTVESSRYLCLDLAGIGAHTVEVKLQ